MNTNLQKKASVNVVANNGQQKDNLPGPKKVRLVTFVIPTANLLGIKRSVLDRNEITVQVSEDSEHNIKKSIKWILCDNNSNFSTCPISDSDINEINSKHKLIRKKKSINEKVLGETFPRVLIGKYLGDPTEISCTNQVFFKKNIVRWEYRKDCLTITTKGTIKKKHTFTSSIKGYHPDDIKRVCRIYHDELIVRRDPLIRSKQLVEECKKVLKKERKAILATHPMIYHESSNEYIVYCPICGYFFEGSPYLYSIFKDDKKVLWLANMVTHYRHEHITSWNKYWGWGGYYYRKAAHFGDYDTEKSIYNERAKRQIARKATSYMLENGVSIDSYARLQGTTTETIETVKNVFANHMNGKQKRKEVKKEKEVA